MKHFLIILYTLLTSAAIAQCGNGNVFVPGSLTPPGVGQSTSLTFNSGQYVLAYVQGGANYQVSTCGGSTGGGPTYDTQLTVYDDAAGTLLAYNDDYCGLQSTVNFTPSFCGYVRILLHQYSCNGSNLPWIVTMTQNTAGTMQTYTLSAVSSQTNVSCFGLANAQAEVSVTGTTGVVRYSWAPSGGTNALATGLSPGIYTVTVSDAGCQGAIQTYTITEPAALTAAMSHTDVSCFGGSNGLAEVVVSGGTIPYTYTWSPSGGNNALSSALPVGNYTNAITDANGCTTSASVTISEPSALAISAASGSVSCFGENTGTATVTVSGGTTPYTYDWAPGTPTGDGTSAVSGLTIGNWTCSVIDGNGCAISETITIVEPSQLSSAVTATNATCFGGANGVANVSVSGGTPGYAYVWSPAGGTGATASGLTAGDYTITITDANSCTITNTITISQPPSLMVSVATTSVACNGGSTGSATVTATGGTGAYTYLWSTAATTSVITGQTVGIKTATVTDANGCTAVVTGTIVQPSALVTNTAVSNVLCNSGSTGSATITASGGTASYTYLWSTAATTSVITGQTAGVKTVTVTDANNCTTTNSVTISQPSALATATAVTNNTCFGGSTGSATITASGGTAGYTYLWSTAATTSVITGQTAGVKTVTVTDANGCTTINSVNITQPATGVTSSTAAINVLCFGNSTGSATVTASGGTAGYTYLWSTVATTSVITGQTAGVKTVTVTDANGCTTINSVNITQPATAVSSSTAVTNVLCNAGSTGSATITATGGTPGYTYLWSTAATTSVITGQTAGVKTVTVTDANGCTNTNTATIIQPTALVTATAVTNNVCFGGSTASATVTASGGTTGYTYLWSTAATTSVITGQTAGVKTVTVTDANGCTTTNSVNITQPATGVTSSTAAINVLCFGNSTGSATVTASGGTAGYTYLWSTAATTSVITGQTAGVKTVTVTDANGCTTTNSVNITQPATAVSSSTAVANVLCNAGSTGSATVTASGGTAGYTYLWSTAATTSVITGQAAGVKTVTVTDGNGCTTTNSVNITQPATALSTATAVTNVLCNGNSTGSATVTASGGTAGYTYLWSTAATTSVITSQTAGVKTVTVTDANGCTSLNSVSITQPPTALSTATAAIHVLCNGNSTGSATVTASGGTAGYTYLWSTAATTSVITGQTAGVKTVTVTDANGCTSLNSVNITQPAAGLSATQTQTNVTCVINGRAAVSVSGGTPAYTYTWSPAGGNAATSTTLSAGTYTCNITDANNCTLASLFTITANTVAPVVAISGSTAICNGSNTTLTASGANTYTWSTSATTSTINVSPSSTTVYSVTGTNSTNGCTASAFHTLTVNSNPTVSISASQASVCPGQTSTLTASGASTYTWSTGSNATSIASTPVVATTYTVTGSNASGCTNTATQTIGLFPAAAINMLNIGSPSTSVCAGSSATLVASGVSTYTWSTGSNNPAIIISPSGTTTYSVNGTDLNGCTASNSITIGISSTPTLSAVAATAGICQGFNTSLNVSGALSYTWSTGATGSSINVSPAATTVYSVTGTNGAGCVSTTTLSLMVYASPTVNIGADAQVPSGTTYQFNPAQTGATSYTWSPATYLSATNILNPGTTPEGDITYILTVGSANGCTASDTVNITVLSDLVMANYMSPNGDGQNDTWKVSTPALIKDYSVTIIDSYGKTVFSVGNNYNNEFDGKLGGQELPDGVYYYFIKDGNDTKFKGSITLTK